MSVTDVAVRGPLSPSRRRDARPAPRPPRRGSASERSRAQTRARLLEAGRALLAERGLHGITTHDVAARAGVASGTFYLHFSDKRELLRVIAAETIALLRERLDHATRPARDARAGAEAFSEALLAFADEHREQVRILFSRDGHAAAVVPGVPPALPASIRQA